MAGELQALFTAVDAGQIVGPVVFRLFLNGTVVGSDITTSSNVSSGLTTYTGDMPAVGAGNYDFYAVDTGDSDEFIAYGTINWDGTQEVSQDVNVSVNTEAVIQLEITDAPIELSVLSAPITMEIIP